MPSHYSEIPIEQWGLLHHVAKAFDDADLLHQRYPEGLAEQWQQACRSLRQRQPRKMARAKRSDA